MKNRGYAANCRDKREKDEEELSRENEKLKKIITWRKLDMQKARKEMEDLKQRSYQVEKELERWQKEDALAEKKMADRHRDHGRLKALMANRSEIKWERVDYSNEQPLYVGPPAGEPPYHRRRLRLS